MPLSDLTRRAVLDAIAECDRLGREVFLRQHGYKSANKYLLLHDGREYDSKAIAGVACGMKAAEFSGGAETVERELAKHDFIVIHADAHWYDEELVLLLHWYLRYRERTFLPDDPDLSILSDTLQTLASARGRFGTARWRSPERIVAQLEHFQSVDPSHEPRGTTEPSPRHQEVWARHADKRYNRTQTVSAILREVEAAVAKERREARSTRVAKEQPTGYRLRAKQTEPAQPTYDVTPEALRGRYEGPRKPAPRTPAAPRVEDAAAWDRANECHEQLRDWLATWLEGSGFAIYEASTEARSRKLDYDLGAHRGELRLVIETKSMPTSGGTTAEAGRLRHGLGQVLWYRQRLRAICGERRIAVLAVEREPVEHEAWREVCREAGVVLVWPARVVMLIEECMALSTRA